MKIYLMVDSEGISGIYTFRQTRFGEDRRAEGRQYMTEDVNAVAEALKEAGVDEVVVRDCHGCAESLLWDKLSDAVDTVILGATGNQRYFAAENVDGIMLLGYHAMAGSNNAFLYHTWSSTTVQRSWFNGERCGELTIDAAIAGEMGIPIIMVSGDNVLFEEAKRVLPWAEYAMVKRAATNQGGALLGPKKAHALLAEKAKAAVASIGRMQPYVPAKPVTIRIECTQNTPMPNPCIRPYMRILDDRTYEVTGETALETLWRAF